MKLTTRIIAVSFLTVLLMFGAASYLRIRTTYDDFEVRHREAATRVADAMVEPLAEVWRTRGLAGVEELLREETRMNRTGFQLRWVWLNEHAAAVNRPHLPSSRWPSGNLGQSISTVTRDASGQREMCTYVLVDLPNQQQGGLELTESLEPVDRVTWTKLQIDLAALVAFAVVSAGIAYWTGVAWIAKPLHALTAKMQRISMGDLGTPLRLKRRDEFRELADDINEMCQRLAEQQAAIQAETAQRLATLEQLRHADRLSSIGRLAAGIAHELGTPLNVVSGRAAMITAGHLSAEELRSSAEAIRIEADRITAIVRQLLDFARRRTPCRAITDLHALTVKTADLVRQLAEKQQVRIEIVPGARSVTATVDASQLQQVLTNMLVNAIHAMPQGGLVRVKVSADEPGSAVGRNEAHFARISIADEGTGIGPDDLAHIFEPFFTTKDIGKGTGLGLSIAYGIIQEHGGRIDVTSEIGQGTCFTIYLPMEGA